MYYLELCVCTVDLSIVILQNVRNFSHIYSNVKKMGHLSTHLKLTLFFLSLPWSKAICISQYSFALVNQLRSVVETILIIILRVILVSLL